jgi:hypothetical protein
MFTDECSHVICRRELDKHFKIIMNICRCCQKCQGSGHEAASILQCEWLTPPLVDTAALNNIRLPTAAKWTDLPTDRWNPSTFRCVHITIQD